MSSQAVEDWDSPQVEFQWNPLMGFINFSKKEIFDWWNSRRALIVCLLITGIYALIVFVDAKRQIGPGNMTKEQEVTLRVGSFLALQPETVIFFLLFTANALLVNEKISGTLAWNLTKPLSRTSVLASKWLIGSLACWLFLIVIPTLVAGVFCKLQHDAWPTWEKITPLIYWSAAWVSFWVLLLLLLAIPINSAGAVGGIAMALWIGSLILAAQLEADDRKAFRNHNPVFACAWVGEYYRSEILPPVRMPFRPEPPKPVWEASWNWVFPMSIGVLWTSSILLFRRKEI